VVRVSKCKNITELKIIWSRRWQGNCFAEFPTNISNLPGTYFVDIHTRRLVKTPSKIPCEQMPKAIYIRSSEGTYYEVTREGLSRRTKLRFKEDHLISEVNINVNNIYDSFETEDQVPTASILDIVQRARLSMIDITRMTQTKSLTAAVMSEAGEVLNVLGDGTGGLISDVGSLFGNVFGGIASGSVDVVKSIASGAGSIVKEGTSIFTGGIWSILGFINNILIWMTLITILGRLSRNRWLSMCQQGCETRDDPVEVKPPLEKETQKSQEIRLKARGFSKGDRSVSEPYICAEKETRL